MCVIFLRRRTEAVLRGLCANKDRLVYFISCAEDELNPPDPLLVFSCRDKWISLSLTPGDLVCCPNSKLDGSKMIPPKGHAKWNFRKAKECDNGENICLVGWFWNAAVLLKSLAKPSKSSSSAGSAVLPVFVRKRVTNELQCWALFCVYATSCMFHVRTHFLILTAWSSVWLSCVVIMTCPTEDKL